MAYLLHTIQEPQTVTHSLVVELAPKTNYVVVSRKTTLEFFRFGPDQPFLTLVLKMRLEDPVEALTKAPSRCGEYEFLVAMYLDRIRFLELKNDKMDPIWDIKMCRVPGLFRLEIGTKLIFQHGLWPCLLIYQYQGYVSAVDLCKIYRLEARPTKTVTCPIGNITVKELAMLDTDQPTFAVLYRDYEFKHSLRYYEYDSRKENFKMVCQFYEFKETPLLLFAVSAGVVVVSDLRVFFMAKPGKSVMLHERLEESASCRRNVVTLSLDPGFLGLNFESATQIDPHRYLMCSDSGQTVILYLKVIQKKNTVVEEFRTIYLGKSTVALSLYHVEQNVFFASSKLSRSILFRVLPSHPHIHVLSILRSSPPVLDVNFRPGVGGYIPELWVCQGGFHSGEFRRLLPRKYQLKHLTTVTLCKLDASSMFVWESENIAVISLHDSQGLFIERYNVDLSNPKIATKWNGSQAYETLGNPFLRIGDAKMVGGSVRILEVSDAQRDEHALMGRILRDGSKVYLRWDNKLVYEGSKTIICDMPEVTQVSCFDVLERDNLQVLVTSWNGKVSWFQFDLKKSTAKQISTSINRSGFQAGAFFQGAREQGHELVVAVDDLGSIIQLSRGSKQEIVETPGTASASPYKLLSCQGVDLVVQYNTQCVLALVPTPGSVFLKQTEVFKSTIDIMDCRLWKSGDQMFLAILVKNGTFNIFTLETSTNDEAFFSDKLLLKSLHVPGTDSSVVIQIEQTLNSETGRMERNLVLKLIDEKSLQVLDTYDDKQVSRNFVDLSLLPDRGGLRLGEDAFVVANNVSDWAEKLLLFRVTEGKMVKASQTPVSGSVPRSMVINKIHRYGLYFHLVGDSHVIVCLKKSENGYKWSVFNLDFKNIGYFRVDCCSLHGERDILERAILVGDASHGMTIFPYPHQGETIDLPYRPCFLTCCATVFYRDYDLLVYGDSVGNLGGAKIWKTGEKFSSSQVFACNVGDQINVIKSFESYVVVGTAGGGLFSVSLEKLWSAEIEKSYDEVNGHLSENGISLYKPVQDWKDIDSGSASREAFGIFDGEVLKFLQKMAHDARQKCKTAFSNSSTIDGIVYNLDKW